MALEKQTEDAIVQNYKLGVLLLTVKDITIVKDRINIICTDNISFSVQVKNEIALSKDKTKKRFVNEFGKFFYATDIDALPEYFKTEQTRPSFTGEQILVNLIINANDMATDADFMLDAKKLIREKDVSEIKSFLIDTQFVGYGLSYKGEQAMHYDFLPADTYPQFSNGIPQTDKVKMWLASIKK